MGADKTNFDRYLEHRSEDAEFRERLAAADRAWDIALQLTALRKQRGLTQQQVADMLGTKQQAIARLEDPSYAGHSLSMIRKYAEALGATVDVTVIPGEWLDEYAESNCVKPLLAGVPA